MIRDVFLVSAPEPIRLVICVEPPASAAECAAKFYDPQKQHTVLVPEAQDIEAVTNSGKTLVMQDGEKATLGGKPCHAVTLLYYPNS